MTAQSVYYPMTGGLDQESAGIAVPNGRVIAVNNHEAVSKGYQRTQGYERIDGRPAPSQASFYVGTFENGDLAYAADVIITGQTSGATGRILGYRLDTGTFGGGNATGAFAIDQMTGTFTAGENIRIGGVTHGKIVSIPAVGDKLDSAEAMIWWQAATENRRDVITEPQGSGAVRGVLFHDGELFAWRDDTGAGRTQKATTGGWVDVDLGHSLAYSFGGPYEIMPGDVITGSISGATATVRSLTLDFETDWAAGTASGVLILDGITGTFEAETLNVGANLFVTTIAGDAVAVTFPAGGRYEWTIHNFYGAVGTERAYGANGVGKAFSFDGESAFHITTGMPTDTPFLIAEHKNHLFLGFPKGSVQFSNPGEPMTVDATLGAGEIGLGKELTNLLSNTSSSLIITTGSSVAVLTGNDSTDFLLETLSDEAGARRFSGQRIGNVLYMDERGIRSVKATQFYGNFTLGTFTTLIQATLETKRNLGVSPCASCVIKGKDQYLLFFDDGTGISLYMGRKNPEAMLFEYPFTVTAIHVGLDNGNERVFVGADDGFVYELNVGTSFDGAEIEAYMQLPFSHQGGPRVMKRYHKSILEMVCGPGTEIALVAEFEYGDGYQPYPHDGIFGVQGSGGLWGISNWGEFYWSAPNVAKAEAYLQGVGDNMSLVVFSKSSTMDSYIVQGATIMFSVRGQKR